MTQKIKPVLEVPYEHEQKFQFGTKYSVSTLSIFSKLWLVQNINQKLINFVNEHNIKAFFI